MTTFRQAAHHRAMRQGNPRRRAEPPEDDGPGAITAAELAEGFVTTMLDYAHEAGIDPGDAAAMAALDLIACLAIYLPRPAAGRPRHDRQGGARSGQAGERRQQAQPAAAAAWRHQARPAGAYRRQPAELAEARGKSLVGRSPRRIVY